jgi:predicted CXXCH cytochrome family protein
MKAAWLLVAAALSLPLAAQRVADVRNTPHNLSTSGTGAVHAGPGGTDEICVFCHTPHQARLTDDADQPLRAPLWNRRVPAGSTYTAYTSSTLDAQSISDGFNNQPGGSSKLCLSCHDGTLAIGNVAVLGGATNVGIPMQGTAAGGGMPAGDGTARGFTRNLGTDLRNDHPISVTFNAALVTRDGELRPVDGNQRWPADGSVVGLRAPGVKPLLPLQPTGTGGLGQVQCTSCHDPHLRELDASKGNQKFLRAQRFQEASPAVGYNAASDIICLGCHDKEMGFGLWSYTAHAKPSVADETYKSEAAALRQFPADLPVWKASCLNCHDTHAVSGTRRLTREGTDGAFSGGNPLGARQGGGAALENTCYQCHTGSAKQVLNNAAAVPNIEAEFGRRVRMPITNADQETAEEKHEIGGNFSDAEVNCASANNRCGADGVESKARLAQRHVECTDCHNPHRVIRNAVFNADPRTSETKGTHRIDPTNGYTPTNIASGVLRGTMGVEPSYVSRSFLENPSGFAVKRGDPGLAGSVAVTSPWVTREYQICLKCHSNYAYGSNPPQLGHPGGTPSTTNALTSYTNQAREFQPALGHAGGGIGDPKDLGIDGGAGSNYNSGNHRSWHPVIGPTGRTLALRGISAAKMPWLSPFGNTGVVGVQTMYCSDCHGSAANTPGSIAPDSGVMGPHGSQNDFLLKAPFNASDPSLCFKCHDREVYSPTGDSKKEGFYTGFCCRNERGDNRDQLHWYHWNKILSHDPGRTLKCNWCHAAVPHGWKNKALLVNLNDVGPEALQPSGNREFRIPTTPSGQVALAYTQEPYYLNAKLKVRNFATSGNWTDTNCGSNNSALTFGAAGNNTDNGKTWMKDTCSNPP